MQVRALLSSVTAAGLLLWPALASAQLTAADVQTVINQAVTRALQISPNSVIAVTDREGNVLGVWNVRGGEPTHGRNRELRLKGGNGVLPEQQSKRLHVAHRRIHHPATLPSRRAQHPARTAGRRRPLESVLFRHQQIPRTGQRHQLQQHARSHHCSRCRFIAGWFAGRRSALQKRRARRRRRCYGRRRSGSNPGLAFAESVSCSFRTTT